MTADRNRDLAAIHVMAAQLGMDTSDKHSASEYRSTLFTVGGPSARRGEEISAAFLDHVGRSRVRQHLYQLCKARGIKRPERLRAEPDAEWDWVNRAVADRRPMLWKIRRLLIDAGRPKKYADRIALCQWRIERIELCGPRQLYTIVQSLEIEKGRRVARAMREQEAHG